MGSSYSVLNNTGIDVYMKSNADQEAVIGVSLAILPFAAIAAPFGVTGAAVGIATSFLSASNLAIGTAMNAAGFTTVRPGEKFIFRGTLSLVQQCDIQYVNDRGQMVSTRIAPCWTGPTDKSNNEYCFTI